MSGDSPQEASVDATPEEPAADAAPEADAASEAPPAESEFLPVAVAPRPLPKRLRFLLGGAALLCALSLTLVVRGTLVSGEVVTPASSKDGASKQLLAGPEGKKRVRYARVLDHAPDAVWGAITAYADYPEIFGRVSQATSASVGSETRVNMTVTSGVYGDWPFEIFLKEETAPGKRVLSWDQPSESLTVNRGSWTVTPVAPSSTLVVYEVEIEVRRVPLFFVRNVLLTRVREPVRSVDRWLKR